MSDEIILPSTESRGEPDEFVRLSAHPRAQASIKRSKAIGGLVGFLLGFWFASRAGLPDWDTGVRALVGGVSGYVLTWLAAVQIWRQIAIAEYRAAVTKRARYRAAVRAKRQQQADERAAAAEAFKA